MSVKWRCTWTFLVPLFWLLTIIIGCCAILPWGIYELRKTGEETHVQVSARSWMLLVHFVGVVTDAMLNGARSKILT